jgi:leader peptidase (prepilin peptidase)/N-methyltransferase
MPYTLPVDLPYLIAWAFALLVALFFGSFLNVCISRLPRHESIAWPGSHCPRCVAPIRARDNVPILSFLLLRGLCRDCRRPISPRYPLVEAAYTILVAGCLARFGFTFNAAAASGFCFLILGLLVMDLETMRLPDAFTLPGIALGLIWAFSAPFTANPRASLRLPLLHAAHVALSALGWALILLILRWSYYAIRHRQGLGLGDIKLIAMIGACLGAERTGLVFFLAVLCAALAGILAMLRQRARAEPLTPGTLQLPLGTFLGLAALYTMFWGTRTLNWYVSFYS